MQLFTNEQQKLNENANICCICKENFEDKYDKDKKNIATLEILSYGWLRSVVPIICNLNYSIPKEVTMIFHNGSNDDYDFIVKTEELKDNLLGLEKILKNT